MRLTLWKSYDDSPLASYKKVGDGARPVSYFVDTSYKDDVVSSRAEVGPRTRGEYWAVVASRFVRTPQLASAS